MKYLSFILFLLVSCHNRKEEKVALNQSINFSCNKIYYAEGESFTTAFEIISKSSDPWVVNDYKFDISYPKITKNEKGFSLINLYTGEQYKLSDMISNDIRYITPGKNKFHLYATHIIYGTLSSINKNEGWVIKYNGEIVLNNKPVPSLKIQSDNIYVPLKDITLQKMDSEEIMYLDAL